MIEPATETTPGFYGPRMAKALTLARAPFLMTCLDGGESLAATLLRHDGGDHRVTRDIAPDNAYSLNLQLTDCAHRELWLEGRMASTEPLPKGRLSSVDLRREPRVHVHGAFNILVFFFPQAALDGIARDGGMARAGDLRFDPGVGVEDPVARDLAHLLLPSLEAPEAASRLFTDNVLIAIAAHVVQAYGQSGLELRSAPGRLAPWQERRAKEVLGAAVDEDVGIAAVARECGLSSSQFSRAFRNTTGQAPYRWLLHRRVERARMLLSGTGMSLSEIALACGFADQSHFTRTFGKIVGRSPGAWRRDHDGTTVAVVRHERHPAVGGDAPEPTA